jgi:membrane fusion protein (multidrug efflux system)
MAHCAMTGVRAPISTSQQRRPTFLLVMLIALLPVAAAAQAPTDSDSKPPPAVVVAPVETKDVDRSERFIGNIEAIQSVDLKARVEGYLMEVAFEQGSMVEKGQVLYRIEQDQYKANLDAAEGQLAAAKAESEGAAADLEDKEADFKRQSQLIKKGDTSQTAFDQSKAARDEARANVDKAKASEQQAQASVESARINLGYTTIASPIDGRIGATAVTQGNLVDSSSDTLATVAQLDPIRAVFSIPSAIFIDFQQRLGAATSAEARAAYVPTLILPNGKPYDKPGKITFADNQVDASTGTVAIYADFVNPDHMLLPGQFVSVVVERANKQRLPVVPAAAVQRVRDGAQVYVVDGQDRVQLRKVKLGAAVGSGYAVESGLTDGELVVVSGLQKVEPGMTVKATGAKSAAPKSRPASGSASESESGSESESKSATEADATESTQGSSSSQGAASGAKAADGNGG